MESSTIPSCSVLYSYCEISSKTLVSTGGLLLIPDSSRGAGHSSAPKQPQQPPHARVRQCPGGLAVLWSKTTHGAWSSEWVVCRESRMVHVLLSNVAHYPYQDRQRGMLASHFTLSRQWCKIARSARQLTDKPGACWSINDVGQLVKACQHNGPRHAARQCIDSGRDPHLGRHELGTPQAIQSTLYICQMPYTYVLPSKGTKYPIYCAHVEGRHLVHVRYEPPWLRAGLAEFVQPRPG